MREVTVNPKFGRRSWVKLWVNEWLEGTTRYEMSDAQRAFWVDLLAMAGRSRFPGIICAGQIDGKFVGYPLAKYSSLMSAPIDVLESFEIFKRNGKIIVEITQEEPKLYKVQLCNWEKFQSEYQRQKPYRIQAELRKSDSGSYNKGNNTETDTETDTETEKPKPTPRFALPEWVPVDSWNDFVKSRKNPTLKAKQLLVRTLQKLRDEGQDPKAVLEQSIERGWRGLFEVKELKDGKVFGDQSRARNRQARTIDTLNRVLGGSEKVASNPIRALPPRGN